jgi:molecular chaperone GrpE
MADEQPTPDSLETVALQARLDQLEKQVADYKLLVADFENARKRLTQDAERQRKYAAEPLARDLLTAFDNLERTTEAATKAGESGAIVQGVQATISQFLDVLKRHGVTRIDVAPGKPFDANLHQAVMQQPTNDFEPGAVTHVLQQGFLIHDRVLRPAAVIVASEPPAGGKPD